MRILHTSDWHLGARLGTQDRLDDQFGRLEELCEHLDREQVDLLLVAGDVFEEHRAEALARIIRRLANLLTPRIEAGLQAVFVAGNHDREHVFPLLRGLQALVAPEGEKRVIFAERPCLVPIAAPNGETVQLVLLPYPTPVRYDLTDQRWDSADAKRRALADSVRDHIEELARQAREAGPGLPTVLCGHFLLRGIKEGFYQLTEQEDVPVEPGDLPAYAYIALGHIHKPQQFGAPYIRYSGSLERMDRGEAQDVKQALLVDVGRGGLREVRQLALNATPFVTVKASTEADLEVAAERLDEPERSLVSVCLELRRDQNLGPLQARARQLFPRLYGPPEVRWLDAPTPQRPVFEVDRRDVAGTVRAYLKKTLEKDADADALQPMAEELLAEVASQP
jgi:DNA repair protein SbcD/Mre11